MESLKIDLNGEPDISDEITTRLYEAELARLSVVAILMSPRTFLVWKCQEMSKPYRVTVSGFIDKYEFRGIPIHIANNCNLSLALHPNEAARLEHERLVLLEKYKNVTAIKIYTGDVDK